MIAAHEGAYNGLLIVAFGGPEGPDDVVPFLERVLAGRGVPRARLLKVAGHYERFGGVSPINAQNRALVAALGPALAGRGLDLPVFLGNRNAPPFLADALGQMAERGVTRALALYTSPYGSFSSCRQYSGDIHRAREAVGSRAPSVDKLRAYFNHPGFINAAAERTREALIDLPGGSGGARLVFTAHSLPAAMAAAGPYQVQLLEACRLVADAVESAGWTLAFQSRSGSPSQPWLEPSLADVLESHAAAGSAPVVVSPIGFLSDHVEVLYDLDVEGADLARSLGLTWRRAATVGTHPKFIHAVADLVEERVTGSVDRPVAGRLPAAPDECAADCCSWLPPATPRG